LESSTKAKFAETNENAILATLSAKVTTTFEELGTPISNAQIIVLNSLGEIIGRCSIHFSTMATINTGRIHERNE